MKEQVAHLKITPILITGVASPLRIAKQSAKPTERREMLL